VVTLDSGRVSLQVPASLAAGPSAAADGVWQQTWSPANAGNGPTLAVTIGPRAVPHRGTRLGDGAPVVVWEELWPVFRDQANPASLDVSCNDCLVVTKVCQATIAEQPVHIATGQMEYWSDDRVGFAVWDLGRERRLVLVVRGPHDSDLNALLPVLWTVGLRH
jgi:hypothetical protein